MEESIWLCVICAHFDSCFRQGCDAVTATRSPWHAFNAHGCPALLYLADFGCARMLLHVFSSTARFSISNLFIGGLFFRRSFRMTSHCRPSGRVGSCFIEFSATLA
eukprot:5292980-Pleurochrysis_carterae.AAC.1